MAIPSLILKRNLRKNLMQGQPWIYQDNLTLPKDALASGLCKLKDQKNELIGWGIYSPQSQLAFRLLTLDKNPPNTAFYEEKLNRALSLRRSLNSDHTNAYRLVNGEGDLLPGFICDIYNKVAVIQFDGQSMFEFWDQEFLAQWILQNTNCNTVYFKPRHDSQLKPISWGEPLTNYLIPCRENGCEFLVDIKDGQKTGFFLDQRDNRQYLGQLAFGKSVLNLFSYTGGFSVYAGLNSARSVTSVDIAEGALNLAEKIWQLNRIKTPHKTQCVDVFNYLIQDVEKFDIVICDPPSMAKSENQKQLAMNKYIEVFSLAAKKVLPGGHLILSSCSSHISFNDFELIVGEALSKARKRGQILRFTGQGLDHPYPQACPHLRYLKFMDLIL